MEQQLQEKQKRKERIEKYIEELIKNDELNIALIPDFIEKQIYRNILTKITALLDHILETTEVKFLGSTLKFDLN